MHLSNLPPGVTTRDIEEQAGAIDRPKDIGVPFCAIGEAYCTRTDAHQHCAECGGDHADGTCNAAWDAQTLDDNPNHDGTETEAQREARIEARQQ